MPVDKEPKEETESAVKRDSTEKTGPVKSAHTAEKEQPAKTVSPTEENSPAERKRPARKRKSAMERMEGLLRTETKKVLAAEQREEKVPREEEHESEPAILDDQPELKRKAEQDLAQAEAPGQTGESSGNAIQEEMEPLDRLEADDISQDTEVTDWLDDDTDWPKEAAEKVFFTLNGNPLYLSPKPDGAPYYLMDLLQYSDINLKNPKGAVTLTVNGTPGMFQQPLVQGDTVSIVEEVR